MNWIIEDFQNATPEEWMVVASLFVVWGIVAWKKRKPQVIVPTDPLDIPIMQWVPGCFLTVRQLLANILILAATGAGKSSGSGKHLMRAIVQYRCGGVRSGMLLLLPKPEDVDSVRAVFREARREDDLLVINADGELRFNFLDYVRSMGGDARELTRCILTVAETLRANESKGGGEMGNFWEQENERLIYNSVVVILLATGQITISDIQKFIMTALKTPQQVSSPEWQGCFHDKCMRAAYDAPKTKIQQHDFDLAVDYFFKEWPSMADKTRSSILAGVLGILHCMNSGLAKELCSSTTNCSPDELLKGRCVAVNLPPAQFGETGMFVNSVWKYVTQKMILRRKVKAGDAPVVIWCDEFQQFVNSHDSQFVAQCRSHLGAMIMISQGVHSLFGAMSGDAARSNAIVLMSNAGHKIFHAVGDADTARYASELLGREERTKIGGSIQPDEDIWSAMFGTPKITTSFSEQWEPVIEPGVFMNGLRTGGPHNQYCVDAIVIKTGDQFPGGGNWRFVTFDQR